MAPHREAEEVQEDEEPRSADDDAEDRKPAAAAARRNKKSKRKFKVFDESGLTDAQRRALRQEQRGLQAGLKAGEHGTLEDLQEAREKNNELFDQVRYTREAVLDADNVDMIVTQYAQKVEKDVQVPRFDPLKLVHKLKQKCSGKTETGKYFDWKLLGVECGICFNALPDRVSFLAGALDHEVHIKAQKPRKKRAAAVPGEDEKDAINPEKVDNNDNNRSDGADKLSAMEKNMRTLKKTLTKKHKAQVDAGGPNEIDAVKFLFNPKSFTQTVENIFNFSFLYDFVCYSTAAAAYCAAISSLLSNNIAFLFSILPQDQKGRSGAGCPSPQQQRARRRRSGAAATAGLGSRAGAPLAEQQRRGRRGGTGVDAVGVGLYHEGLAAHVCGELCARRRRGFAAPHGEQDSQAHAQFRSVDGWTKKDDNSDGRRRTTVVVLYMCSVPARRCTEMDDPSGGILVIFLLLLTVLFREAACRQ